MSNEPNDTEMLNMQRVENPKEAWRLRCQLAAAWLITECRQKEGLRAAMREQPMTSEREAEIHRDMEQLADDLDAHMDSAAPNLRAAWRELRDERTRLRTELETAKEDFRGLWDTLSELDAVLKVPKHNSSSLCAGVVDTAKERMAELETAQQTIRSLKNESRTNDDSDNVAAAKHYIVTADRVEGIIRERDAAIHRLGLHVPRCSLCHGIAEFSKGEKVWRHAGEPMQVGYMEQQFCDKYGYPIEIQFDSSSSEILTYSTDASIGTPGTVHGEPASQSDAPEVKQENPAKVAEERRERIPGLPEGYRIVNIIGEVRVPGVYAVVINSEPFFKGVGHLTGGDTKK